MATLFFDILKTARPRQWVKNLTLYAAYIFTAHLYSPQAQLTYFWYVTEAIAAFTLVAGAVYFFNDIRDIKSDQAHPFKKRRPIASGRISLGKAWVTLLILVSMGLFWAQVISPLFFFVLLTYLILMIAYSLWLKNIEVLDVFVIAIGFFLRVVAGSVVINAHLPIWFYMCVVATSLFLAVGKRRAELAILTEQASAHRKVMGTYTAQILDAYLSMFATAAFMTWSLYTFNFYEQADINSAPATLTLISKTFTVNKWLMASIPVVIFGIMRYIRIIYDGSRAETPERVMFADKPLLISVAIWAGIVMAVLYWLPK